MMKLRPTALSRVALAACKETDQVWSPTTPSAALLAGEAVRVDVGSRAIALIIAESSSQYESGGGRPGIEEPPALRQHAVETTRRSLKEI